MPSPPRLTVLPFLQRWDETGATLHLRVLVVPTGDPLRPLTEGWPGVAAAPAFSESELTLAVHVSSQVDALPMRNHIDLTRQVPLVMPAVRGEVFEEFKRRFVITKKEAVPARLAGNTLRKFLPPAYRAAFGFTAPRTPLATIDDEELCALRCPPEKPSGKPPAKPDVSWGDTYAAALRQELVARALGLLHDVTIAIAPATLLADGGWIFVSLDGASDYAAAAASPGFLRTYATRVPPLKPAAPRQIFTPVVFPVADDEVHASTFGNFDNVFREAVAYDDGFAKIVHASQSSGASPLDAPGEGLPALRDEGVFLGWDDEDVLIAQNRQIGFEDGKVPPDAPLGVSGYRIDVRPKGSTDWTSLSRAEGDVVVGAALGHFDGELRTEVFPSRLGSRLWLPAYFTTWRGRSMVVRTADDQRLAGVPPSANPLQPVDADEVPLVYGDAYEFRVRLCDTTSGGPGVVDKPFHAGDAPIAGLRFTRRIPPAVVGVTAIDGPAGGRPPLRYRVARPTIAPPQALFTGAPGMRAKLLAIVAANQTAPTAAPVVAADPHTPWVRIRVLVRAPAFDPRGVDGGYFVFYTTFRTFPSDPDKAFSLTLDPHDCRRLEEIDVSLQTGDPGTAGGPVPVPTARDVVLELCAFGKDDPAYWDSEEVRVGAAYRLAFFCPATAEPNLFAARAPQEILRSIFLRAGAPPAEPRASVSPPTPSVLLLRRLAAAAGLVEDDGALVGEEGERTVFGCSTGLAHELAPDATTLALGSVDELPGTWINVVRAEIDRDWTWQGGATPIATVVRTMQLVGHGSPRVETVGAIRLQHSVNNQATRGLEPRRDHTALVFVDAFKAPLGSDGLPYQIRVTYTVVPSLQAGDGEPLEITNMLPVTARPAQIPKVVAAGHALSPYRAADDYSETSVRQRMLWLEMEEPPRDSRDTYFMRILAHAPDPMLLPAVEPAADPTAYAESPLDPEWVRVVTPGQADDFAGLSVMQRLIPAQNSERHFIVPLPPNTDGGSPELFGFYTYELCVGHDRGTTSRPFWSTAQARFGAPLVIEGVQHPSPALECAVSRRDKFVIATALYAEAYYDGRSYTPNPPNTEMWFLLYAQVRRADGAVMRNILLDSRRGTPRQPPRDSLISALVLPSEQAMPRERPGDVSWRQAEIDTMLAGLSLPHGAPLSVLAVELMPEPNGYFDDPLGADLGQVRIVRTSPLRAVEEVCC
jgi:hypothetical protein